MAADCGTCPNYLPSTSHVVKVSPGTRPQKLHSVNMPQQPGASLQVNFQPQ